MSATDHWTDQDCQLRELDEEAQFIADNLDTWHYTPGRRKVIADLNDKYGRDLP